MVHTTLRLVSRSSAKQETPADPDRAAHDANGINDTDPIEDDSLISLGPSLRSAPAPGIADMLAVLEERSRNFNDRIVDMDDLTLDPDDGALRIASDRAGLRPHAFSQLANKLGVPASYLRRCDPDLRAANINRWLDQYRGNKALLRMDGEEVRAILSTRYRPVDNLDLARAAAARLDPATPIRWELTETRFEMQVIGPAPSRDDSASDPLHGGFHLANSEVGAASISVSALIFRSICLNGLILGRSRGSFSRRHIGCRKEGANIDGQSPADARSASSLPTEIDGIIEGAICAGEEALGAFRGTRSVVIPEPSRVFERIGERHGLSAEQRKAIGVAYEVEPGGTLYHAINAVTRAGNEASLDLDSRLTLQRLGGDMLRLAEQGSRWLN